MLGPGVLRAEGGGPAASWASGGGDLPGAVRILLCDLSG